MAVHTYIVHQRIPEPLIRCGMSEFSYVEIAGIDLKRYAVVSRAQVKFSSTIRTNGRSGALSRVYIYNYCGKKVTSDVNVKSYARTT